MERYCFQGYGFYAEESVINYTRLTDDTASQTSKPRSLCPQLREPPTSYLFQVNQYIIACRGTREVRSTGRMDWKTREMERFEEVEEGKG